MNIDHDVHALRSKVAALEQLLEVLEETTIDQSRRLEDALRDNDAKAKQILAAERERARWATERANAMEKELTIARHIQTSILPRTLLIDGLEMSAQMLPAEEVGGDYYDVIPVNEGCWLGIGDVAGHGLNAGLVMMMTQSIAASVAGVDPGASPAQVLSSVNSVLFENIRRRLLREDHVTLTLLRYSRDGSVVFAGAHEDIVVCRTDGRCETFTTPGPWVGVISDIRPVTRDSALRLYDGDVLVLFTDGVTEAMNERREQFGLTRMCDVIRENRRAPPHELSDALVSSVKEWCSKPIDDITVLAARYSS